MIKESNSTKISIDLHILSIDDIEKIIFSFTEYKLDKLMRVNIAKKIYNKLINTIVND